jgi:hypothetical protein
MLAVINRAASYPATITNTTITAGGTSQVLQAAKPVRNVLSIQNTSDTVMWLNFGAVAAADSGISIAAGTTWTSPPNFCPNNSVNVIGATTGKKFSWYWN